jgi:putative transposase
MHAYCLMTHHIHFLVTPESKSAIPDSMKVVGSRYAADINRN